MNTGRIKELTLEAIQLRCWYKIGNFMRDRADAEQIEGYVADSLAIRFTTDVLGQKQRREYAVSVEVPASWWQHLKRDTLPRWFAKRWPVRYRQECKTFAVDHMALFPEMNAYAKAGSVRIVYHSGLPFAVEGEDE